MSSLEYYSDSWENKSAPEYKEFKAEIYEKKNEYFSGAPEIKRFDVESFDHSPIDKKSEDEDKKKKIGQVKQKEKTRTRLQKILDNVSKTATKVATTVVGVAAVGVGAVIALSPLFSPSKPTPIDVSLNDFVVGGNYAAYELEISELSPDIDYDIVISDGKDEFINEEVLNGTNSELVIGLDTDIHVRGPVNLKFGFKKGLSENMTERDFVFTDSDDGFMRISFRPTIKRAMPFSLKVTASGKGKFIAHGFAIKTREKERSFRIGLQ